MPRRSKILDTLIPILYLKGVSSGDFGEALAALIRLRRSLPATTEPSRTASQSTLELVHHIKAKSVLGRTLAVVGSIDR
jgi:hypothetical protein